MKLCISEGIQSGHDVCLRIWYKIRINGKRRINKKGETTIARQKREWYSGAVMHIMGRGVRRQPIFRSDEDYLFFKLIMEETMNKHPFEIWSYCLMTNHFHLLLKTESVEIWKIMNRLMSSYARNFNGRYGYTGHLFDSRYVSRIVEDNRYLLEVSRYIHLNPVKAGMVREPEKYEFSSYGSFVGNKMETLVTTDPVLDLFTNDPCGQYRRFVEGTVSHTEMENLIQSDMREDEKWLPW